MDPEDMLAEDLFDQEANDDESDDSHNEREAEVGENGEQNEAQLELGKEGEAEKPKKRVVRNPQPKLDADRVLGARGIPILEDVFSDFKPKGKGEEFRDLDKMMKRLEHWAHRLYPKLPFDDVMGRISQLGKKKNVQVNLKKIRMGMATFVNEPNSSDDEQGEPTANLQIENEVQRYADIQMNDEDDIFDKIIQEQEASRFESASQSERTINTSLSGDQRERMIRNKQIAEEKRRQKQLEKEREQPVQTLDGVDILDLD